MFNLSVKSITDRIHQIVRKYFYFRVLKICSALSSLDLVCEVKSLEVDPKVEVRYV